MNKEKIFGIGVLLLVVVALGLYGVYGRSKTDEPVVATVENVAKVNDVTISKATFDAQLASVVANLKAQGVDTTATSSMEAIRTQVLNDIISNELVSQEIAKAGIQATTADIETQYQALLAQVGGADKLKAQLTAANIDEAQLRVNISKQLAVQTYLLKNIDVSTATATDAEIKKFYDDSIKGQKDAPTLKAVTEQIRQQIIANKQQALIADFVLKLRNSAKIEIY